MSTTASITRCAPLTAVARADRSIFRCAAAAALSALSNFRFVCLRPRVNYSIIHHITLFRFACSARLQPGLCWIGGARHRSQLPPEAGGALASPSLPNGENVPKSAGVRQRDGQLSARHSRAVFSRYPAPLLSGARLHSGLHDGVFSTYRLREQPRERHHPHQQLPASLSSHLS